LLIPTAFDSSSSGSKMQIAWRADREKERGREGEKEGKKA
jgi:hypothetical protein